MSRSLGRRRRRLACAVSQQLHLSSSHWPVRWYRYKTIHIHSHVSTSDYTDGRHPSAPFDRWLSRWWCAPRQSGRWWLATLSHHVRTSPHRALCCASSSAQPRAIHARRCECTMPLKRPICGGRRGGRTRRGPRRLRQRVRGRTARPVAGCGARARRRQRRWRRRHTSHTSARCGVRRPLRNHINLRLMTTERRRRCLRILNRENNHSPWAAPSPRFLCAR
jgi:hypothetical protein